MAGKILLIIAGILTLLATFVFSWGTFAFGETHYIYGVGGIYNVIDIFTKGTKYYRTRFQLPEWSIYVIAVVVIWLVASGPIQIIGRKSRKAGIIGSIIPLLLGLVILLNLLGIPFLGGFIRILEVFGTTEPIIEGLIPLHISVPGRNETFGIYLLIVGGILGLIGAKKNKSEY
jgi:hypothetical protein